MKAGWIPKWLQEFEKEAHYNKEVNLMESKKWWTSKTEIFNALALLAGIAQLVTGEVWLTPEAQVGIVALVNIILRIFTGKPLSK